MEKLYLDDFKIGQTFISKSHTMDKEQIIAFAKQFDPQYFHLDDEAAKSSIFKGLAASGWHTGSITMKLLVEGGLPIATGLIGAGVELNWTHPTRAGDTLTVYSEIIDIIPSRSKPNQAILVVKIETKNQNNEIVQSMKSKIVSFKKAAN